MEKFIITPKEDTSVTMTIRIDRALQEEYNELAAKTNRSRNELICMALKYALNNMELKCHQGGDAMKNIIRWFVLLIHWDMQGFEMDEDTNKAVYSQILKRAKRPAEK